MKRGQKNYAEYARSVWNETIAPLRREEEKLRDERAAVERNIAGLRGNGGWNPVRGVREAYRRSLYLPPLISRQAEIEKDRAENMQNILNAARGIAAHICAQEAKHNAALRKEMAEIRTACEAAEREIRFLAPLIARTDHMMERMETTHAECRLAKTMCEYGMVGGGVAISMMADSRQKAAERALNSFAQEMKNYAASLAYDYPRATRGAEEEKTLAERLRFEPACFGGKPDFSAYLKNHKIIEQAMDEIERVHAGTAAIRTQLTGRLAEENRNFAEADLRLRALQADVMDKALPGRDNVALHEMVRNPPLFPVSPLIYAGKPQFPRL